MTSRSQSRKERPWYESVQRYSKVVSARLESGTYLKMQSPIEPHAQGALLTIKAVPGGRQNELRLGKDGTLRVVVTQVAEKGKANSAIIALLAKSLRLGKSQFQVVRGATSRTKTLFVEGVHSEQLVEKLDTALGIERDR